MWVRIPSRLPTCQCAYRTNRDICRKVIRADCARVAQLAELRTLTPLVVGSTPTMRSKFMKTRALRRAITEKLKWKRRLNHGFDRSRHEWFHSWKHGFNHSHILPRIAIPPNPTYAKTPCVCSCSMCRNPRRDGYDTQQERKADESFRFELERLNDPTTEWEDFEREGYWIDEHIWSYHDLGRVMESLDYFDSEGNYHDGYYELLQRGRQPFRIPFMELIKFR